MNTPVSTPPEKDRFILGRKTIIAAAAGIYLLVLACIAWPGVGTRDSATGAGESHVNKTELPKDNGDAGDMTGDIVPAHGGDGAAEENSTGAAASPITSTAGLPYRSITLEILRVDWIDRYKKCMNEIADLGADTVLLVVDSRQQNGHSSHTYLDMRTTPTVEQLGELIDHARSLKLRVILMPIVLLDLPTGNEWRGTIKPESWDDWFDSYRQIMTHFATVAEAHHVDMLVVGSELVSTEPKLSEWTKTIAAVRAIFKGRLTYSANWDHYANIQFWDQLDLIGMNSYWKFAAKGEPEPTVQQIEERWNDTSKKYGADQKDLLRFVKSKGKPLFFTEIGWFSQVNVAYEPWDYTKEDEPIDLDLQKHLYEAFFNVWYGNPLLGGFSVWEWKPDEGGPENRGYTPKGKPAEKVLRTWLAKPPWEVKLGEK